MRFAILQPSTDDQRRPIGRRAMSFALVLLVHAFLAVILLFLTPELKKLPIPKVFVLSSYESEKPSEKPQPKKAAAKSQPKPTPAKTPPIDTTDAPEGKLFDKVLFDAIDITKLPNQKTSPAAVAANSPGADSPGADSQIVSGPWGRCRRRGRAKCW